MFRRRHLERRLHPRFWRDVRVVPHVFLAREALRTAELRGAESDILDALVGEAVWTLDTATRLAGLRGFLPARDLTGCLRESRLSLLVDAGRIGPPGAGAVSVDPLMARAPLLVVRVDVTPTNVVLPTGHRIVSWDQLLRDLLGTLGWRPDLLTRLESAYREAVDAARQSA